MFGSEFVFASCGDFDGLQLMRESKYKNFKVPNYLKRWINLKKVFSVEQANPKFNEVDYVKAAKPVTGGMTDMLKSFGIKLEGRHHSGIDDSRNLASIVVEMLKSGFVFSQGMVNV